MFYVIPIRDGIGKPTLFAVRNGVKEAISVGADFVVLDMETPGGELGATLEIMEILARFEGTTITYVNREAISAGALISAATHKIYFAPNGVIGAAAPVTGGGKDIDETMKQKVVSYLLARVRTLSREHPHRSEVVAAMVDVNYELKIGGTVIKEKGGLLTLTDREAMKEYGDPPQPLYGAGIVDTLPELFRTLADGSDFTVNRFEITWSLTLAQWLTNLSPILLGLGGLLLYIEFKTPGFGVFGISGIGLLLLVFFGHNLAGLSGHEPMLIFLLGVALVFIELIFFPGLVIPAVTGLLLMFGSLLWGMADIWPDEPFSLSGDLLTQPLINLGLAAVIAGGLAIVLVRFLPRGWFFERLAISHAIAGSAQSAGISPESSGEVDRLIGRTGRAVTGLFPSGQVEIEGRRYEARVAVGTVAAGTPVVVRARSDFGVIVEAATS